MNASPSATDHWGTRSQATADPTYPTVDSSHLERKPALSAALGGWALIVAGSVMALLSIRGDCSPRPLSQQVGEYIALIGCFAAPVTLGLAVRDWGKRIPLSGCAFVLGIIQGLTFLPVMILGNWRGLCFSF